MEFRINKASEFPIYQQLKEQIKYFILSAELAAGDRLPPPKDLAAVLCINRNTVIAAYKELETEGLLEIRHGQGAFVTAARPQILGPDRRQQLVSLAQEAVQRTRELGFSPEDLFTVIFGQTVLGLDQETVQPQAVFIECNQHDIAYYSEELARQIGMEVEGCLLAELPQRMADTARRSLDVAITTFSHVEDVKSILEPYGKPVLAVMAVPQLKTLFQISNLPAGTRVGFVCATEEGAARMENALQAAGVNHIELRHAGLDHEKALKQMLPQADVVVSSRAVIDKIKEMVPAGVAVLEFINALDQAGLTLIKQYLNIAD